MSSTTGNRSLMPVSQRWRSSASAHPGSAACSGEAEAKSGTRSRPRPMSTWQRSATHMVLASASGRSAKTLAISSGVLRYPSALRRLEWCWASGTCWRTASMTSATLASSRRRYRAAWWATARSPSSSASAKVRRATSSSPGARWWVTPTSSRSGPTTSIQRRASTRAASPRPSPSSRPTGDRSVSMTNSPSVAPSRWLAASQRRCGSDRTEDRWCSVTVRLRVANPSMSAAISVTRGASSSSHAWPDPGPMARPIPLADARLIPQPGRSSSGCSARSAPKMGRTPSAAQAWATRTPPYRPARSANPAAPTPMVAVALASSRGRITPSRSE